jgi:hypothetical protein
MKKYIAIIILLIAVTAYAFPPTPPTVNITGNAATATSLAANPTDCGANAVATAIDASGNLTCGYSINTNIQAYDADLDTWADITPSTDVQTMLGSANATAIRSNIGLGTIATQNADNATITGGSVTGLTTLGATNATITSIKTAVAADNTLSGTPVIITVYDMATNTPYYFKAYPTK